MVHDSTDDSDEPSTQTARVLLTDGGSEAEQEASDESDESQQQDPDESDDQEETPAEPAQIEADDEAVAEQTGDVGVEPQEDESIPTLDSGGDTASIIEVRNQVIELSTDVIGRSLDGIVEVSRNEDNWRAVVEIIERRSVPDTQDILGQYEIELDKQGEVIGYRRLEKYRRADTGPSQH
jgi:hypothetical protein